MQASSEALVLEEYQSGDPPLMSQQVHLCITFFVRLCVAFSDLVLEEHQIGDPPLTSQQVCLCIAFSDLVLSLCTFMYRIDICYFMQASSEAPVLEDHQIGDPPLPPQCTCIFVDIGIYIFFMQLDSEQVVLEEHPIGVAASEAP